MSLLDDVKAAIKTRNEADKIIAEISANQKAVRFILLNPEATREDIAQHLLMLNDELIEKVSKMLDNTSESLKPEASNES